MLKIFLLFFMIINIIGCTSNYQVKKHKTALQLDEIDIVDIDEYEWGPRIDIFSVASMEKLGWEYKIVNRDEWKRLSTEKCVLTAYLKEYHYKNFGDDIGNEVCYFGNKREITIYSFRSIIDTYTEYIYEIGKDNSISDRYLWKSEIASFSNSADK